MTQSDRYYLFFVVTFVTCIVLSNVVGVKLIQGPLNPVEHALTSGIIIYPFSFLLTDIVSEIWGAKRASYMVYFGFAMSCFMLLIVNVILALPAHPYWVSAQNEFGYTSVNDYQNAFASVFSVNGKLVFGSMLAYAIAQKLDVSLFHFFKKQTRGRFLWLRNNGSTLISQLVDTFVVNSILFYWGLGWSLKQGLTVMVTIYVYKILIAFLDTPLAYLSCFILKKKLKPQT